MENGHVRTLKVAITVENSAGKSYTIEREATGEWKIGGPVYPRHIRLMQQIDSYFKYTETAKRG